MEKIVAVFGYTNFITEMSYAPWFSANSAKISSLNKYTNSILEFEKMPNDFISL